MRAARKYSKHSKRTKRNNKTLLDIHVHGNPPFFYDTYLILFFITICKIFVNVFIASRLQVFRQIII
jgi:hypothetical protein